MRRVTECVFVSVCVDVAIRQNMRYVLQTHTHTLPARIYIVILKWIVLVLPMHRRTLLSDIFHRCSAHYFGDILWCAHFLIAAAFSL